MEKYKICPTCGMKNEPTLLECSCCETDLARVKVTDEESEQAQEERADEPAAKEQVRICECGAKNKPNARKCSACGEDISDIQPTDDPGEPEPEPIPDPVEIPEPEPVCDRRPTEFTLTSYDGTYSYRLTERDVLIGRDRGMSEYLREKRYVSRIHARLTIHNDELFVTDEKSVNHTFVNNRQITERTQLKNGDILSLGGFDPGFVIPAETANYLGGEKKDTPAKDWTASFVVKIQP